MRRKQGPHPGRRIALLVLAAAILAFLLSPLKNYPVSLAVMRVYSHMHWEDSIMAEKGIDLSIPGGGRTEETDWYPFVMAFNDTAGFRRFTGQDALELTILYNFPAFDIGRGCSRLYDPASPYYGGFYGAYLVSGRVTEADGTKHPYGFLPDGALDAGAVAEVPRYDLQHLVLSDLGLAYEDMVFDWQVQGTAQNIGYAGSDGWARVDALLTVNGPAHERTRFRRSYLQYGPPGFEPAEPAQGMETVGRASAGRLDVTGGDASASDAERDFLPVEMRGRVYGKYFPEWDTSVFFYVLARDAAVVETCDRQILSASRLEAADARE